MTHSISFTTLAVSILLVASSARAGLDPVDWVDADYALNPPAYVRDGTRDAQYAIVKSAEHWASRGPFSVVSHRVRPPSGDPNDYLSWAPYYWPKCHWCSRSGHSHLAHGGEDDQDTSDDPNNDNHDDDTRTHHDSNSDDDSVEYESVQQRFISSFSHRFRMKRLRRQLLNENFELKGNTISPEITEDSSSGKMSQNTGLSYESGSLTTSTTLSLPTSLAQPIPDQTDVPISDVIASTTTSSYSGGTPAPARHAAKHGSKCTPSPTHMAPSTTWTSCPYVRRDGRVNPDVRSLPGVGAIQHVSEAVFHNAFAFAFLRNPKHSRNVARLINVFFLDSKTRMNPNLNFGQIVRGPGRSGQEGSWTGILDLRGMVKILNGLTIMKASGSSDWNGNIDAAMNHWMRSYGDWLYHSHLGKKAASRPNNHGTFYVSQVAAAKLYSGDKSGAARVLEHFFERAFKDQIARSGEQPFEATRTRPQHYRAFNLEALITNAKLGDQVGKNFWVAKSKYGTTIQDAVDFAMSQPFKKEDPSNLVPHVAAIAAQYGDPTGKYAAFVSKYQPDYGRQPFWFYDQSPAFAHAHNQKRSSKWVREDSVENVPQASKEAVSFECPAVFAELGPKVELDLGVWVTCDDLRQFFE